MDIYGTDTALDISPLQFEEVTNTQFSSHTKTFTIKFKIPDSVMYTSSYIQEPIIDSVIESIAGDIDIGVPITREVLVYLLEYYAVNALVWDSLMNLEMALIENGNDTAKALQQIHQIDSILKADDPFYELFAMGAKDNLAALLQLFSIKIVLFAEPEGAYKIRSDYTVRYNSKFVGLSGVPIYVNTNPQVDFVGVYKVKGADLQSFDTTIHDQPYELLRLFGPADSTDSVTTIIIDKGYSYFFTAASSGFDSAISMEAAFQQKFATATETHYYQWYFQHDSTEIGGVDAYDFLKLNNEFTNTVILNPPKDAKASSFVLWAEVWDNFFNEMTHPMASMVKEVRGRFTFTSAYLKSLKDDK